MIMSNRIYNSLLFSLLYQTLSIIGGELFCILCAKTSLLFQFPPFREIFFVDKSFSV